MAEQLPLPYCLYPEMNRLDGCATPGNLLYQTEIAGLPASFVYAAADKSLWLHLDGEVKPVASYCLNLGDLAELLAGWIANQKGRAHQLPPPAPAAGMSEEEAEDFYLHGHPLDGTFSGDEEDYDDF